MINQVQVQEQGWRKKHEQAWMMKLNNLYEMMNYLELHKQHIQNNTLEVIGLKFKGIDSIKPFF